MMPDCRRCSLLAIFYIVFRLIVSQPLSETEIALRTTPEEQAHARTFGCARRRCEWLSWRAIVRRELCCGQVCDPAGIRIGYDAAGAPRVEIPGSGESELRKPDSGVMELRKSVSGAAEFGIPGSGELEVGAAVSGSSGCAVHVAVSHCEGSIAVAFADTPCAVDVESAARDFGRVVSRYMTVEEQALSDMPWWPAVVWCAKETLYKFAGRRELDLLRDLRIEEVDFHTASLVGRICGGEALRLYFLRLGDRIIVFLS